MLGVHEAVKQWNLRRGLERGRRKRDELIRKWLSEERAKGDEGFKDDPPFLNNGYED
ncbi:MAG: hypothetical protein OXU79_08600 [Gemmatimonadota bacterium]|nr:hypothetical protein [Gemmatimonadota bacterium]